MLTVKCRLPDQDRESDDICHILCLQIDAIAMQARLYDLQREILDRLRSLEVAMRGLTTSLGELRGAIGAGGR